MKSKKNNCLHRHSCNYLLNIGYFMHKNKKENYIETQEERLNLYFKYNLKKL